MAQKFTKANDLITKMKKDLTDRTFPHLLTHLVTASKVKLQSGLYNAATRLNGKSPPLTMFVSKIPLPGFAELKTVFLSSDSPTLEQKSVAEAKSYKQVFRKFNEDILSSKALVMNLLASVGVT